MTGQGRQMRTLFCSSFTGSLPKSLEINGSFSVDCSEFGGIPCRKIQNAFENKEHINNNA